MRKVAIRGFTARYLYLRGDGNYVYRRVIPADCRILANGKREFKESLRTRKHTDAVARYGETNAKYEAIFDQLRNGIALGDQRQPTVDELKAWAKSHKVSYKSVDAHIAKPNERDIALRLGKWIEAGHSAWPVWTSKAAEITGRHRLFKFRTFMRCFWLIRHRVSGSDSPKEVGY